LDVRASFIHSESSASYVFGPDRGFLAGDASFGSLTISGALIGKTVTFSGTAAADTVLYSSPTETITLDKQTVSDFLPPSDTGVGPNRITRDALDISCWAKAPLRFCRPSTPSFWARKGREEFVA
jgi:hypothetical protein